MIEGKACLMVEHNRVIDKLFQGRNSQIWLDKYDFKYLIYV